jgi:hypothetical protein
MLLISNEQNLFFFKKMLDNNQNDSLLLANYSSLLIQYSRLIKNFIDELENLIIVNLGIKTPNQILGTEINNTTQNNIINVIDNSKIEILNDQLQCVCKNNVKTSSNDIASNNIASNDITSNNIASTDIKTTINSPLYEIKNNSQLINIPDLKKDILILYSINYNSLQEALDSLIKSKMNSEYKLKDYVKDSQILSLEKITNLSKMLYIYKKIENNINVNKSDLITIKKLIINYDNNIDDNIVKQVEDIESNYNVVETFNNIEESNNILFYLFIFVLIIFIYYLMQSK